MESHVNMMFMDMIVILICMIIFLVFEVACIGQHVVSQHTYIYLIYTCVGMYSVIMACGMAGVIHEGVVWFLWLTILVVATPFFADRIRNRLSLQKKSEEENNDQLFPFIHIPGMCPGGIPNECVNQTQCNPEKLSVNLDANGKWIMAKQAELSVSPLYVEATATLYESMVNEARNVIACHNQQQLANGTSECVPDADPLVSFTLCTVICPERKMTVMVRFTCRMPATLLDSIKTILNPPPCTAPGISLKEGSIVQHYTINMSCEYA